MLPVGGLRLSEFLVGPSLTHEVALRNQLLTHCATSKSLPLSELLEVLERLSRQEDAREAVVDAARRLGPDLADVRSWLDAAICDATVPLCTRLQLHLLPINLRRLCHRYPQRRHKQTRWPTITPRMPEDKRQHQICYSRYMGLDVRVHACECGSVCACGMAMLRCDVSSVQSCAHLTRNPCAEPRL